MKENQEQKTSILPFSNLTGLQLFQLIRYATFVFAGIGFAKIQLPQSTIGQFETFLMVSGMVSFFWVSGIINTMLSTYAKFDSERQRSVFFNTFVSLFVFGIVAGALLLLFSDNLLLFLDKKNEGSFIRLAVIYLIFNSPSFLIEYILFLNNKREGLIAYALLSSFVTLAVVLLPPVYGYDIEYSFYGLIAVAGVKLMALLFLIHRFGNFRFNTSLQTQNLRLSLPLMLSIFVSGSSEYIDGLIVKSKFDDVAFAVYRYGAKELPVLLIVANTFSTAMIAVVAGNLANGLSEMKRRSTRLMHLFFPLTIVLMLVSHHLYQYVFSENFIYSAFIFNIYLLLVIPRLVFPQTILTGIQHSGFQLVSSIIEITLNVSLSWYLAGKLGLPGIAIGTFIAFSVDKLFLITVNHWRFGIAPGQYIPVWLLAGYSLLTLLAFGAGYVISVRF
jgi:O-antigen/teichoic acid export membrane protein